MWNVISTERKDECRQICFLITCILYCLFYKGKIFTVYFPKCHWLKKILPFKKMHIDIRTLSVCEMISAPRGRMNVGKFVFKWSFCLMPLDIKEALSNTLTACSILLFNSFFIGISILSLFRNLEILNRIGQVLAYSWIFPVSLVLHYKTPRWSKFDKLVSIFLVWFAYEFLKYLFFPPTDNPPKNT